MTFNTLRSDEAVITRSLNVILKRIADITTVLFLILAVVYYFVSFSFSQIRLLLLVIAGAFGFLSYIIDEKINILPVLYISLAIGSWMICYIFSPDTYFTFNKMLCSISYMGIGLHLSRGKHSNKVYSLLFYFTCAVLLFKTFVEKVSIRHLVQDGSSFNYISVICLCFLLLSSVARLKNGLKISIFQVAVYIFITVLSYGRGGLLSGFLLLFGIVLKSFIEKKSKWKILLLGFILLGVVVLIVYGERIIDYLLVNSNLLGKFSEKGLSDNGRVDIWVSFFKNNMRSPIDFFFGSDPVLIREDSNLHNSFLQMYSSFGLLFFLTNIVLICFSIRRLHIRRDYLLLFLVLIVRASTDRVFYHGINELMYYYFIFAACTHSLSDESAYSSFEIIQK